MNLAGTGAATLLQGRPAGAAIMSLGLRFTNRYTIYKTISYG
jgi:hypothetical protein